MSGVGPPPFDTSLLRRLAGSVVDIGAYAQGACESPLSASQTWRVADDLGHELIRVLGELGTVRALAHDVDVMQAVAAASRPRVLSYGDVSANLRRMSGRDLAEARALSRVVVEGACEV